ncbi:MAG: translation initiation factor IF-2 [Lachnospiraceae bacterium]|nr:translation initiation factor IF-2 [Lachnospiraceae bacterium]
MAKIRVYELAKNLNKSSKEIIEILKKNGVEVTSHSSSVTEEDAARVTERIAGNKTTTVAKSPEPVKPESVKEQKETVTEKLQNEKRAEVEKRQSERRTEGNVRPQGYRRIDGNNHPQGERRDGGRPQGERREFAGNRPQGDRRDGGRPQGDRRDFNGSRDNRGSFNGRSGQGSRRDGGRRDDRREEKISIPAPMDRASMDRDRMDRHNQKKEREKTSQFEDGDNRKKSRKKDEHFTVKGTKPVKKPVQKQKPVEPAEPVIRTIELPEVLTVQELADKVKTPVSQLIKKLFLAGEMVTVNTDLEFEKAAEIALEYNCIAEEEVKVDVIEEMLKEEEEDESLMSERPPVVCVMGHVDHGKTSLLDAIRETSVTSGEAGGITQHIGAYTVDVNGQQITFLDTPGHEAFTAMRMRGAQSTDIAILVVAADDGVMPQTVEAINHAKAAGIEIIVAVNKIDKESANVERVKQELVEYELIAEDWGGSTVFCPVSAHTKEGIDNLLEMILLTAEVLELKANPNRRARGIVIEAELDKGRGPVATMLVQKGTLKIGDSISVGSSYGRVRAMIDDKGQQVKIAGPSKPVEILGLNGVPAAGEIFVATQNEKEARTMAETYIACDKEKLLAETKAKMSLDDLFNQIQAGNVKELNLVVKADVQGSVEAVKQSLLKLSNEEVVIKVIHAGVGAINESDVILASASNAIIIGFNVRPDVQAKDVAEREKVDLRLYKVIYNAIEDIEAAMKGMLDPIFEEQVTGHLIVRQTFKASGVGTIAGSFVLDGVIRKKSSVRITRDGELIFEGALASLKRFKDDVKEVKNGFECGIVLEDFNDLKEDDQIEAYEMVEVPR